MDDAVAAGVVGGAVRMETVRPVVALVGIAAEVLHNTSEDSVEPALRTSSVARVLREMPPTQES